MIFVEWNVIMDDFLFYHWIKNLLAKFFHKHGPVQLTALFDEDGFQLKVIPIEKRVRNQNFDVFVLLENKIGD